MNQWPMVSLRDILYLQRRWLKPHPTETYREIGIRSFGKGIFHKAPIEGSGLGNKRVLQIRPGDLVFNNVFAWEGAVAVAGPDEEGLIGSHRFITYTVDPQHSSPEYLKLFFTTKAGRGILLNASPGSAGRNKTLGLERFVSYSIPLPSLKDQRRLVECIHALTAKIEEAKKMRQEASEQSSHLLGLYVKQLFNKGKQEGWQPAQLGSYITDSCYGTSEKTSDDDTATPVLRMGNIQGGKLVTDDLKYLHLNPSEQTKLLLESGDILVNRTNSAELVGKSAVFDLPGEYAFASYIIRVRIDQKRANPYLIAHYINSPLGRAYMLAEKKQMTGQANVNTQKIRAMPIWLPRLEDQSVILGHLEEVLSQTLQLHRTQDSANRELNAMLPAILDRAFKGEL